MLKTVLLSTILFSSSSYATGYLVHENAGPRVQITGVSSSVKPGGSAPDTIEVHLLSGPEGAHECSFPISALQAQGYRDIGSLVSLLANPDIRTYIYCYTDDGKAGSTSNLMIDNRF